MINKRSQILFHLICFILNFGVWAWHFSPFHPPRIDDFGGSWRYLTFWGTTICAFHSTAAFISHFVPKLRTPLLLSITLPMVSFIFIMYWTLFSIDPNLVNARNVIPFYIDYQVHVGATVLAWIDALYFHPSFKNFRKGLATIFGINILYIAWVILIVQPLNPNFPCNADKSVCGFPYPFLNDMNWMGRSLFFLGCTIFFLALFWGCFKLVNRYKKPQWLEA